MGETVQFVWLRLSQSERIQEVRHQEIGKIILHLGGETKGIVQSAQDSFSSGPEVMESEVCEQDSEHEDEEICSGVATTSEMISLLKKQQFRCALSGQDLTVDNVEIDHVVPVGDGGGDNIENIQLIESRINRMKNQMGNDEFIRLCRLVSQWDS